MSKETGVSNVILKRWIAWYCRKSNYYAKHIQGVTRFHLDGSEAGIVTEKHQEKMERKLESFTKKSERINIRLTPYDLDHIKRIATKEGLPYQTLISSILHKYAAGYLRIS